MNNTIKAIRQITGMGYKALSEFYTDRGYPIAQSTLANSGRLKTLKDNDIYSELIDILVQHIQDDNDEVVDNIRDINRLIQEINLRLTDTSLLVVDKAADVTSPNSINSDDTPADDLDLGDLGLGDDTPADDLDLGDLDLGDLDLGNNTSADDLDLGDLDLGDLDLGNQNDTTIDNDDSFDLNALNEIIEDNIETTDELDPWETESTPVKDVKSPNDIAFDDFESGF